MRRAIVVLLLIVSVPSLAFAKQFYASDFEKDTVGKAPQGWELGFKGAGEGKVIEDPVNPKNKVFAHSDLPSNQARHDVGGSIWVVGSESWTDYIVEYDAYFPEEYYMGVLFRFVGSNEFYLFDRRSGGEAGNFDFWKRAGGTWTGVQRGAKFDTKPGQWYRFRLTVKGDTFSAYGKSKDDETPFEKIPPIITGKDSTYKAGKFGLYGLIYVDNVIIGETEADLVLAVKPFDKSILTWGKIKETTAK